MPPSKVKLSPDGTEAQPETLKQLGTKEPIWQDFQWSETDEPHASRRKMLMKKYPELETLFGVEPLTFPIVIGLVVFQMFMAYMMTTASWPVFILCAYFIGGTINHTLNLAIHELAHNLCFETPLFNRITAVIASLPTCVPSSTLFRRYHMMHHQYQGVEGIDVDLPTTMEVNMIQNSTWRKLLFVIFQIGAYSLRPAFVHPLPIVFWQVVDIVTIACFVTLVAFTLGPFALLYFYLSDLLGNGIHPSAGHFIAEHYTFRKFQETFSYYGPMNYVNFNVGYHNEHHDFPRVPWSRLPKVREIAAEFYDTLPYHTSYVKVLYDYVTDPTIGPFSRVKRTTTKTF